MTRTHGRRVCPGCGVVLTRGSQTKEHVWSDWLRRYGVAYPRLSPDFFGQRSPLPQRRMVTGADGRRQYEEVAGPVVSDFLATVTMSVCGNCNNTWMSQIENAAKDELAPVFLGGARELTGTGRTKIATWVALTLVAYSQARNAPVADPIPRSQLAEISRHLRPPDGWRIWMGYCPDGSSTQMAAAVAGLAFSGPDDKLTEPPPDNFANCYLAAHGVYFVAHYASPSFPSILYEAIFAPALRTGLLPLWPNPSPSEVVRWPEAPADHRIAVAQSTHVMRIVEAIGLPEEGLNRDQIARVTQEFHDGAEPWELRDRFASGTP